MSEFRRDSYWTPPPETADNGQGLNVGQTHMTIQDKHEAKQKELVRPVPTKRELEDWAEEVRGLAFRASDLRGGEELAQDLDGLEARISVYL